MSALFNCRQPLRLSLAHNYRPRGTPMESAQGWRSQTKGKIFKWTDGACADPGTQNFPCHGGGAAGGQGHSLFSSN